MPHDITPVNAAIRDQAQKQALDLNGFDYNAPAKLFPLRNKRVATMRDTGASTPQPRPFASPSRMCQRPRSMAHIWK